MRQISRAVFLYVQYQRKLDHGRSVVINDDQWWSATGSMIRSLQITADRDKLTDQTDQEHAGSWIRHGREYGCTTVIYYQHHASCRITLLWLFRNILVLVFIRGLKTRHSRTKKGADRTDALFSFSWIDIFIYVSALYVVISIQIAKKKLSAVCIGLTTFTFADTSQGNDITYHEIVKHISVHLYKSDQQSDEIIRPSLAHTHCQRIRRVFL